jgi:putative thioredoxin
MNWVDNVPVMPAQNYVFDVTPASFKSIVLENSSKGPAVMYYWSPNAGPCMMLLPRLVKLADDYSGRFLLTLLNCDQYKAFSKDQGVISIPAVQVYVRGEVAETIHGAYSERHFRDVIDKFVRGSEGITIGGLSPQKHSQYRAKLDQAKQLVQTGNCLQAAAVLDALPAEAMRDPEVELLSTHLDLIRTAELAPNIGVLKRTLEGASDDAVALYQQRHILSNDGACHATSRQKHCASAALVGTDITDSLHPSRGWFVPWVVCTGATPKP